MIVSSTVTLESAPRVLSRRNPAGARASADVEVRAHADARRSTIVMSHGARPICCSAASSSDSRPFSGQPKNFARTTPSLKK